MAPRATIVIGLGNGDEGKGSLVDHLVRLRGARCVVRFNGGAQALHHVAHGSIVHGFSQFGAGTLAGARTVLSRFMLFEPLSFCREAEALSRIGISDPYSLVTVSAKAPVITPANILANRILETHRGGRRHGSCGLGIGLTQGDVEELGEQAIYAGDLANRTVLREKLSLLWWRRLETVREADSVETRDLRDELAGTDLDDLADFYGEFARRIRIVPDNCIIETIAREETVFEGAQGVLLDQRHGFFPHVTRSTTTFENAEALLDEAGWQEERVRVGLLRAYATRHGAGPLPTENADLRVASCHNEQNSWQGAFRVGWFDAVTARYAIHVAGRVDVLGITNVDRLVGLPALRAAASYCAGPHFPDGEIPPAPPHLDDLRRRTDALSRADPQYVPMRSIASACPHELNRYAAEIEALVGHDVSLVSARPDHQKLYRRPRL